MTLSPKIEALGQISGLAREIEHSPDVSLSVHAAELSAAVCLLGHQHPSWASTRRDLLIVAAIALNWILAGDRADDTSHLDEERRPMPRLIADVTAGDGTTLDELAAFLENALRPGGHTYGERPEDQVALIVTHLEVRRPDGEHYRDNDSGKFTTETDNEARPGSVTHESAE